MREPTRTTTVQLDGVAVPVTVHGRTDGVPVVLLPGGAAGCAGYFPGVVDGLTDRAGVVVHDRPGTGASSRPVGGTTVRTWAADTVALLDALDVPRALLVGHSLGASVAAQVVLDHPDRVAGALLLDPTPLVDEGICGQASRLFRVLAAPTRVPVLGRPVEIALTRLLRPRRLPASALETYRATFPPGWLADTDLAVRSLPADAAAFTPRPTGVPVQLVTADRPATDRLRLAHERMATALGGSSAVWAGTTHVLHMERPDRVLDATTALLEGIR